MTLLDNKSRTTLKKPMTSRTAGPTIKKQVTNTRITMTPRAIVITLAIIQKGAIVRA
jgi:hypothetical protein